MPERIRDLHVSGKTKMNGRSGEAALSSSRKARQETKAWKQGDEKGAMTDLCQAKNRKERGNSAKIIRKPEEIDDEFSSVVCFSKLSETSKKLDLPITGKGNTEKKELEQQEYGMQVPL